MTRQQTEAPKGSDAAAEKLLKKMYISNVARRLRELNNPSDNDRRRWVWELIQNAKDTISQDPNRSTIDVKIIVDGDTVQFIHNGNPFTLDARYGLLWKYSEDKESQESTGRFGTGFLTTHCLSKVVTIRSDVIDEDDNLAGFEVTMYRDGQNEAELLEGLSKMKNSEKWYNGQPFNETKFTYHVKSESGRRAIKLGLESFYDNIAPTMLFCKELQSVELDDNGKITHIERGADEDLNENGLRRAVFTITEDDKKSQRIFLYKSFSEPNEELTKKYKTNRTVSLEVAIEIGKEKEIIEHQGKTAFFCSLPLVGIENQLDEPVIVNSRDFEPDSERQSLLLSGEDRNEETQLITETGINRMIYKNIIPLYRDIVVFLNKENYYPLYSMANGLKKAKEHDKLDKGWYKNHVIDRYRSILLSLPVAIASLSGEHMKLNDAIIVKETKEEDEKEVFELLRGLYPTKLVKDNHDWAERLWNNSDSLKLWNTDDLCKDIEAKGNWNNLDLAENAKLVEWYNRFLNHVKKYDSTLLDTYALLPDLNGKLHTRKEETFKQGENLTDSTIKLLNELGSDVRPIILDTRITAVALDRKYNSSAYSAELNRLAKTIIEDGNIKDKLSKLSPLLRVLVTNTDKYGEFCKKRADYFGILKSLFDIGEVAFSEGNNIQKSAWESVDEWFEEHVLSTIAEEKCLTDTLTIESLNNILKSLRVDVPMFNKYQVIPNQKGEFCFQEDLYQDGGIPEVLKDKKLELIGVDFKSKLLALGMDADKFAISKKLTISDVANEIDDEMSKENICPQEALNQVACYLLTLLPKKEGNTRRATQEGLLKTAGFFLKDEKLVSLSDVDYTKENLWSRSNYLVSQSIISAIESAKTLEQLKQNTDCNEEMILIGNLNAFYCYLNTKNISTEGKSIYPNQNGDFKPIAELKKEEGTIADELKNIISLIDPEHDYRNLLMDVRVKVQPQSTLKSENAYKHIDDLIAKLYETPSSWDNENFKRAVRMLIEEWGEKHDAIFKENFPKVYSQKDSIELNVVWTKAKRQQAMDISSKLGEDLLKKILETEDLEVILQIGRNVLEKNKQEQREREYKLALGKYVEGALKSVLDARLQDKLGAQVRVKPNQDANGCDFIVEYGNGTDRVAYYIEVKSRWTTACKDVDMTYWQVDCAKKSPDNYALCYVDMSWHSKSFDSSSNPDLVELDKIVENTKVLTKMGVLLDPIHLGEPNTVHISDRSKITVPYSIIEEGCSFDAMIASIVQFLKNNYCTLKNSKL